MSKSQSPRLLSVPVTELVDEHLCPVLKRAIRIIDALPPGRLVSRVEVVKAARTSEGYWAHCVHHDAMEPRTLRHRGRVWYGPPKTVEETKRKLCS